MVEPLSIVQYIVSGILVGGVYGLMTVGLSIICGVSGLVNFAQGSFLMVAMYLSYFFWLLLGFNPYFNIIIVFGLFFLFGLVIYRSLYHPIIRKPRASQVIYTIGLSIIIQNLALLFWRADYRGISGYASDAFEISGIFINKAQLVAFAISIVATIILSVFLKKTDIGKAIRATADDRENAMLVGINVKRVTLIAFAIGTALEGIAGALTAIFYSIYPAVAMDFIFLMFVAMVLGGLGSLKGSMIGGLVVGLVQSLSVLVLPMDIRNIGVFILFLFVLLFKPFGLYGKQLEALVGEK